MRTTCRPDRRRGFALVEMVLVIGALSIILVLFGGLLHTLLRLDRVGREVVNDANTLGRVSRQFRRDVRASASATIDRPESLQLKREGSPAVSYHVDAGRIVREERDGKTLVRRESYPVARLGPVSFHKDGPFVRVVLSRRPTSPNAPGRAAVSVEAFLDKDRGPWEARK